MDRPGPRFEGAVAGMDRLYEAGRAEERQEKPPGFYGKEAKGLEPKAAKPGHIQAKYPG